MKIQDNMHPPEAQDPVVMCPKKIDLTEEQDDVFNITIMNMFNMLIFSKILNENTNTWVK